MICHGDVQSFVKIRSQHIIWVEIVVGHILFNNNIHLNLMIKLYFMNTLFLKFSVVNISRTIFISYYTYLIIIILYN